MEVIGVIMRSQLETKKRLTYLWRYRDFDMQMMRRYANNKC